MVNFLSFQESPKEFSYWMISPYEVKINLIFVEYTIECTIATENWASALIFFVESSCFHQFAGMT